MGWYRNLWRTTVTLFVAVSFVVGTVTVGWLALLGTATGLACLGVLFAFSWFEDVQRRRRVMTGSVGWSCVVGVLVLGLPPLLGAWSLAVLLVLGVSSPALVGAATRNRRRRPAPPTGPPSCRDLEWRWQRTSAELRRPSLPVPAVLRLVQERSRILDELEQRDPDRFVALVGQLSWRELDR